jgi:hypothetical protein
VADNALPNGAGVLAEECNTVIFRAIVDIDPRHEDSLIRAANLRHETNRSLRLIWTP